MGKDLQKLYWGKCLGRSREGSNCRQGEASDHSASWMPMKGQSEGRNGYVGSQIVAQF